MTRSEVDCSDAVSNVMTLYGGNEQTTKAIPLYNSATAVEFWVVSCDL